MPKNNAKTNCRVRSEEGENRVLLQRTNLGRQIPIFELIPSNTLPKASDLAVVKFINTLITDIFVDECNSRVR